MMSLRSLRTPALVVACGCIIMTITFGVRAGFGLFLQPMSLEYGWGREVFSLSMALQNLAWGALGAVAGVVALVIPLAAPLAGKPAASAGQPQSIGEALHEAMREKGFHLLFWGYFVCGFHIAMLTVHLPSFVTDAGLKVEHGMTALALIGLFNIIGTLSAGWLGGRFSKKYLLSTIYSVRGVLIAM